MFVNWCCFGVPRTLTSAAKFRRLSQDSSIGLGVGRHVRVEWEQGEDGRHRDDLIEVMFDPDLVRIRKDVQV